MGEEEDAPPSSVEDAPSPAAAKAWSSYISEELPRSVQDSADSAIRSARSLHQSSSTHLRSLRDFIPQIGTRYTYYEEAFFHNVKDELTNLREHPALAAGLAVTGCLLLLPGPRRFLFRKTLGRLQSQEAVKEIRENFIKKVAMLKCSHANMWEDFLRVEGQRRQQARQNISASGFGGYKQSNYPEFDNSSGNLYHSGHSRGRYPNAMDSYPSSRPHGNYDDLQRHRRDDFGKTYNNRY